MPAGRPTEYNAKILVKANEYLSSCEDEEIQQLVGMSQKGTELYKNKVKVMLPTIEGLALHIGISRETVYDWEDKYTEFSDIIKDLRAKQAVSLINNGLSGDYNPTIAKVLLTKHGYREGIEQTGKDGSSLIPDSSSAVKDLAKQLNDFNRNRGTGIGGNGTLPDSVDTKIPD